MRKEVIALGQHLQVLEDARRAGIVFAGKLRSLAADVKQSEISEKVLQEFEQFKKSIKKGHEVSEELAAKYFLKGFQESYFDD